MRGSHTAAWLKDVVDISCPADCDKAVWYASDAVLWKTPLCLLPEIQNRLVVFPAFEQRSTWSTGSSKRCMFNDAPDHRISAKPFLTGSMTKPHVLNIVLGTTLIQCCNEHNVLRPRGPVRHAEYGASMHTENLP